MQDKTLKLQKEFYRSNTLRPFLYLINDQMARKNLGERLLFDGDGLLPYRIKCKHIWYFFSDGIMYLAKCMKKRKARKKRILLSSTFLWLNRYKDVLNEILERNDVAGLLSFSSCDLRKCMAPTVLDNKRFEIMDIHVGISVASWETKRRILKLFRILSGKESVKSMDSFMYKLEKFLDKDIERMVKILKNEGIEQYITINQYYLKEYITIAACKKLGIKVKEVSHGVYSCYCIPEKKKTFYSFADQMYFWSQFDLEWTKRFHEFIGIDTKLEYKVCGSLELCSNVMKMDLERYKRKRIISLLMSHMVNFAGSDSMLGSEEYTNSQYEEASKIRIKIMEKIYILAQRENMIVYVRYHPSEYQKIKDMEKHILEKYGFSVIENGEEGLKRVLCESACVIGGESSSLFLANAYGVDCYCLATTDKKFKFENNSAIKVITMDDIEKIKIEKRERSVCKQYCLNYNKLFDMS